MITLKDKTIQRVKLPQVTLAIVDCVDYKSAVSVLQHCINLCEFDDAKFFTHFENSNPYIVKIDKIKSIQEYSHFMIKKLANYLTTEFVLIVQADGFIINSNMWDSSFLNYDYIGGSWTMNQLFHGANPNYLVGNGGFSLRSRKLHEFLRDEPTITRYHPEDLCICQYYRRLLEEKGFTFAPKSLADKFSCENYIWTSAFGQHAYFYLNPATGIKRIPLVT